MLTTALTAITAAVVGVILNLAVWFGMHVFFDEVRTVTGMGFNLEVPVLASVDLVALGLVLAAVKAVFGFRFGPVRWPVSTCLSPSIAVPRLIWVIVPMWQAG